MGYSVVQPSVQPLVYKMCGMHTRCEYRLLLIFLTLYYFSVSPSTIHESPFMQAAAGILRFHGRLHQRAHVNNLVIKLHFYHSLRWDTIPGMPSWDPRKKLLLESTRNGGGVLARTGCRVSYKVGVLYLPQHWFWCICCCHWRIAFNRG